MPAVAKKLPTLSRNLVILFTGLFAILMLATVIIILGLNRNSPFKISVGNEKQSIEFEFYQNTSLGELLDKVLSQKAENSPDLKTQKHLVESVLEHYKFYAIPSEGAAAEIRRIRDAGRTKEAGRFVSAIRSMLYDLDGPFSQPKTLLGIRDDRLLNAFEDLYSTSPQNPLLVALWERSLERRSFLNLRNIQNVQFLEKPGLAKGFAATCVGSVLFGKSGVVTTPETGLLGKDPVEVAITEEKICPDVAARSSIDLLRGNGTIVWISPIDMEALEGGALQNGTVKGVLTPFPRGLRNTPTPNEKPTG